MGKTIPYPLTYSDIQNVADSVESITKALIDSRLEGNEAVFDVNVEVRHPDADFPVGVITFYDGWLGFFPYPVAES